MIYADLNVICIHQKKYTPYCSDERLDVEAHNRNSCDEMVYPMDDLKSAHALCGWWYTYWPKEEYFYEFPFFDLKIAYDNSGVEIIEMWEKTVTNLLQYHIQCSPIHKIGVIVRIQGNSQNICHKEMKLKSFMALMHIGKLRYNELYIVVP